MIKRPNNAVKINQTGAKLLKQLLSGRPIETILKQLKHDPQKICEIRNFMMSIKYHLENKDRHIIGNPAVEVIPFTMEFSKYPVLSELALTYRCNLKCSFCYAGCNQTANPAGSNSELSTEELKVLIRKLKEDAKVPSISFTGGEPTLVKELPELIRFAKSLDMRVNLISNGTLIDCELSKKLADHGLDSAQISIEATTAAIHDKIVGKNGAFEKSVKALQNLKDCGIHTHCNTTITRENLDDIMNFPSFVKNKLNNSRFSMNLIIPTGSAALNERLVVKYSEIGPYIEKLKAKSDAEGVEFMWYSPVPMCMFNPIIHGLGNKGCSACDGLISLAPNGDVLPCASYDDSVGNLLKQDFNDIWHSVQALKYREKSLAHEQCKRCENFHICNGACPLYWRQIGFNELLELEAPPEADGGFAAEQNSLIQHSSFNIQHSKDKPCLI